MSSSKATASVEPMSEAVALAATSPEKKVKKPGVAEEVQQRLLSSPYIALRRLSCEFHEGILTLRGTVPSFFLRQMALQAAQQASGIEILSDRLIVKSADESGAVEGAEEEGANR